MYSSKNDIFISTFLSCSGGGPSGDFIFSQGITRNKTTKSKRWCVMISQDIILIHRVLIMLTRFQWHFSDILQLVIRIRKTSDVSNFYVMWKYKGFRPSRITQVHMSTAEQFSVALQQRSFTSLTFGEKIVSKMEISHM